jgi:hypothetical protein
MKSFEEIKNIYEEAKSEIDQTKEHPEKFIVSLGLAYPENIEFLKNPEYAIKLSASDWIVLAIEPEILKKTVLRAKDLGFLEAYQQNPSFLKQDVDKVIKRMGELEHLGIPYKSEKGKYQSFLFSERGFTYVINEVEKKSNDLTPRINDHELKELADRVIETFAMENKKQEIYKSLEIAEKEGLGLKETLMKVFGTYSDNLDYLSSNIDEIIANNNEIAKGRVA